MQGSDLTYIVMPVAILPALFALFALFAPPFTAALAVS
jgi:hypothetical protein